MTRLAPLLALCLAFPPATSAGAPPRARRLAVLVGANGAPAGRVPLRFAHRDAERLRDALVRVAGVAAADATLLLDPEPGEVLASLQRASAAARAEPGETVLYFYYSGHADDASLYPGGRPLAIASVREALVTGGATVRVGIFDACRGGAWTRAKGLAPAEPVELRPPWALAAEGTVLFASSSGLEAAHESDRLQASFFTHHLVGGLLGAADTSGDGEVTATEAFQYAQARTVRDSALASLDPQHPSFELNLHGRTDLVLAQLDRAASTLAVEQSEGPLQVIELPLGLVLLELPEGKRSSRLSVAPGPYLIRRVGEGGVVTAREVKVAAGETTTIEESSLTLVGVSQLERKGDGTPPPAQESILPAHTLEVALALGAGYVQDGYLSAGIGDFGFSGAGAAQLSGRLFFAWAPVDRLEVSFLLRPGLTVLLGTRREDEVLLHGGLEGFGISGSTGGPTSVVLGPGAGAAYRHWFSPATSLAVAGRWRGNFPDPTAGGLSGNQYDLTGGLVASHTVRGVVSLNFSAGISGWPTRSAALTFGSGRLGFRTLPLLRVHLTPVWSIDLDAQVAVQLQPAVMTAQQYLLGFSATW